MKVFPLIPAQSLRRGAWKGKIHSEEGKQKGVGRRIRKTCGISPIIAAFFMAVGLGAGHALAGGIAWYERNDPPDIEQHLGHSLDLVIDWGVLASEPSSVVDLTGDAPRILRRGKGDVSFFEEKTASV